MPCNDCLYYLSNVGNNRKDFACRLALEQDTRLYDLWH
jgi:hypothetical protein